MCYGANDSDDEDNTHLKLTLPPLQPMVEMNFEDAYVHADDINELVQDDFVPNMNDTIQKWIDEMNEPVVASFVSREVYFNSHWYK